MKIFHLFFLFFGMGSTIALTLPSGFTLQRSVQGFDLVWSSESIEVRMGASRYEFRFADGTVFGYPREIEGALYLPLTDATHETLESRGPLLEVWLGSKRIDDIAPMSALSASVVSAEVPPVSTPTVSTNPAEKGNFTIRRASYNLSSIALDGYPAPIEVIAEVTDPPQATGKRPLVLFLHGRHSTCYQGGPNGKASIGWPCPQNWLPIPSHKGYRYIADTLASQGYIVISISANGINSQDYNSKDYGTSSRSKLIRHHLSLWVQWNTNGGSPWGDRFKGRVDMNKVVLVGHSNGGEGVHKAAIDASPSDPYKIVGLVTYGPTAFGRQVTPDVHSANILPTCDGDVFNLQGQAYVDASRDIAYSEALRTAVISVGANNKYFNTEWTPGLAVAPTWDDSSCRLNSVRLTPQEQQLVGAAYTAALVKLAVNQDATMLPLLDGSNVRPAILGRADVATSAVGGAKNRVLYRVEDAGKPTMRNGMTGLECLGNPIYSGIIAVTDLFTECGYGSFYSSPHWFPISSRPSTWALELLWSNNSGAFVQFSVPLGLRNLTMLDSLDVRIANNVGSSGLSFHLLVADQSGRNATLSTNLTTIESFDRIHARTLRGSLASVRSKVNLGNIVNIFLVAQSATGRVWVLDIAASQARIQMPVVLNLPKLSIETKTFVEADGFKQYKLNIIADRLLTTNASIWIQPSSRNTVAYQLDLVPSKSKVVGSILVDHVGDQIYSFTDYTPTETFFIEAIKGVLRGNYSGSYTIVDDEEVPIVSVNSSIVTAREGRSLRWTFKLSTPTEGKIFYYVPVGPKEGKELTTGDVAPSWLQSVGITTLPTQNDRLSLYSLFLGVRFDYGSRTADLVIPLNDDALTEGNEVVVLQAAYSLESMPILTGIAVDN
jgi:hypothetical protein